MNRYPHLFEPLTIKGVTFKNRVMASPISLFDLHTSPEHRHSISDLFFYRLRASGGAAVVTLGDSIVHPSGNTEGLNDDKTMLWRKSSIPFLCDITDEIHRYGAYASIELNHDGIRAAFPGTDAWGASEYTRENGGKVLPMTEAMIEEVAEGYGLSAENAKKAGFDMVMLHAGHGWLLGQFLSPFWNHRTDRFGGSLENRARFTMMAIESVRRHCGSDFPIEVRFSGDEAMPEGLPGITIEEGIAFAEMLDGKVDLLHVSAGNNNFGSSEVVTHPSLFLPHGVNVKYAAAIKPHVKTPVVTVGSLSDPEMMEEIIASGKADLVAVGRSLIADPALPNKARAGKTEDIRPCLRCFQCLGVGSENGNTRCSVNPEIGRAWEHFYPLPKTEPKRVLIAGGGPGGMQAALTAKERGHEVILCEKEAELGGTIRYSRSVAFKEDLEKYLNYLRRQIEKAGIEVRLNTPVTPALIEELAPDHVIAAVGAEALIPPIPGIEKALPLLDVYLDRLPVGETAAVIGGGLAGIEAAIELAREGKKPVVIEMGPDYAPDCNVMHRMGIDTQIEKYDLDIRLNTRCVGIEDGAVICVDSEGSELRLEADTVILAAGTVPRTALTDALREVCYEKDIGFDFIGDCRRSGQVMAAVRGGCDAALNL